MEKHAVVLPTETTLCGIHLLLDAHAGWVFTEKDMRLRKGQQYNLFCDSVNCVECLKASKTLVDNICSSCGTVLGD